MTSNNPFSFATAFVFIPEALGIEGPVMSDIKILGLTDSAFLIMMLINIILLIVGCLMEANAAIIILIPILVPIATQLGMSPITFGVLMTVNLCMGLLTPPLVYAYCWFYK